MIERDQYVQLIRDLQTALAHLKYKESIMRSNRLKYSAALSECRCESAAELDTEFRELTAWKNESIAEITAMHTKLAAFDLKTIF